MFFIIFCTILLLLSIFLYYSKRKFISLLIFFYFLTDGYQLSPSPGGVLQYYNFAVIYVILLFFIKIVKKEEFIIFPDLKRSYKALLLTISCSIFFSLFYHGFSLYDAIRTFKTYYIFFFCIPLFSDINEKDIKKIIKILYYITIFQCLLYILQILYEIPILNYYKDVATGESIDQISGISRFYNRPILFFFFFPAAFYLKDLRGKFSFFFQIILVLTLIADQSRTAFINALIVIVIASLIGSKKNKFSFWKIVFIFIIISYPLFSILSLRFGEGGTLNEISNLVTSNKIDVSNGTLSFRFAILVERASYLLSNPFPVGFFGLGFADDSSPLAGLLYHFRIGNITATGSVLQMVSPDISWVDLIVNLGFVGALVFLFFIVSVLKLLITNRDNDYKFVGFLSIIFILTNSVASSAACTSLYYILPMFVLFV